MLLLEQVEPFDCSRPALPGRFVAMQHGDRAPRLQPFSRDVDLELRARELLRATDAARIARFVRVEWQPRLKSCAGRADYRAKLVSLNPRLAEQGEAEIDRTLRHELAHLLAQRCHNLPFPIAERARRFLYKCPSCRRDFARVRRIRRAIACLACCRAHNRGEFDARFRLQLVTAT